MKGFKKVTAIVLSAAMMIGSSMTAFAADPTTNAGTGNILDYKVQTQVVPTSLSLAINPNGYPVNIRYAKLADDAEYSNTTKYYTLESDGTYKISAIADATAFASAKANLYTATTSNAQIVTFNYGLANESTVQRKISVKFDVVADENVEFVDAAAKATNEATADDGGAKVGEYKVFLQLVPAKAGEAITAATYAKATGDYDASGVYYTKSGTTYTKVETNSETDFDAGNYYVSTTTIGTEILAKELADVTMTNSTAPIAFATGSGTTSAEVAFSLPKATYDLKQTEFIDFNTATNDVESKFEMTGIGGLSGFTFTGTMNTNTEWSQLETKTITITPTYRFEDATGLETAVSTGLNQVVATPANTAPTIANSITFTKGTAQIVNASLGSGNLAATKISSVAFGSTSTGSFSDASQYITKTNNSFTIKADTWGGVAADSKRYIQVKFDDTAKTTIVIEVTIAEANP